MYGKNIYCFHCTLPALKGNNSCKTNKLESKSEMSKRSIVNRILP